MKCCAVHRLTCAFAGHVYIRGLLNYIYYEHTYVYIECYA